MAGKNKLLRWLRAYVNGYELSGDARTVGQFLNSMEGVDFTAWSDSVRWSMADLLRQVGIRGFQCLLNDTASSGAHTVLKNPSTGLEVSFLFGGGAEPTYGDPAYILYGAQFNDNAGLDGQAHTISGDFLPQAETTTMNPFGVVLLPDVSISATTNGTEHDNGAASTNGYHANLHVLATAAGNFELKVQHSETGAWGGEEADLFTFTSTAGAITSEHQSGTGTVNQYVRAVATRTAGTITAVIVFARN